MSVRSVPKIATQDSRTSVLYRESRTIWIVDTVNYFPLFSAPFIFTISRLDCDVHTA